ncbi:MAG: GNAT family N-acetyltransferase [Cyanothece sp. SIO2G6]|nr:GNAT family N-acetyltransferase [Cyanothece sp. SIO2G6]
MQKVTLQISDPAASEAIRLIEQLDRYLAALYPSESNHLLSIEVLQQPNVLFVTANVDGVTAGCGAIVNHDREYAEIKRMFVLPNFRGLRIGHRLLEALENWARDMGLAWVRLETGMAQPQALSFYEKAGYQPCQPFGSYHNDPLSIFMEKRLT